MRSHYGDTGPVSPLFAPAPGLARADHPRTSHAAAQAVAGVTGAQRRVVLACIALAGENGLTDEQGIAVTEIAASAYRPRRVELIRAGLVRDSGRTRRLASGRHGIVWTATDSHPPSAAAPVPTGAAASPTVEPAPSVERDSHSFRSLA